MELTISKRHYRFDEVDVSKTSIEFCKPVFNDDSSLYKRYSVQNFKTFLANDFGNTENGYEDLKNFEVRFVCAIDNHGGEVDMKMDLTRIKKQCKSINEVFCRALKIVMCKSDSCMPVSGIVKLLEPKVSMPFGDYCF